MISDGPIGLNRFSSHDKQKQDTSGIYELDFNYIYIDNKLNKKFHEHSTSEQQKIYEKLIEYQNFTIFKNYVNLLVKKCEQTEDKEASTNKCISEIKKILYLSFFRSRKCKIDKKQITESDTDLSNISDVFIEYIPLSIRTHSNNVYRINKDSICLDKCSKDKDDTLLLKYVHSKTSNKTAVLKICNLKKINDSECNRLFRELKVHKSLQSRGCKKKTLIGVHLDESKSLLYILTEIIENNLEEYLDDHNNSLSIYDKLNLIYKLSRNIFCLHRHYLIHNNLSSKNIFIDDNKNLIIGNYTNISFNKKIQNMKDINTNSIYRSVIGYTKVSFKQSGGMDANFGEAELRRALQDEQILGDFEDQGDRFRDIQEDRFRDIQEDEDTLRAIQEEDRFRQGDRFRDIQEDRFRQGDRFRDIQEEDRFRAIQERQVENKLNLKSSPGLVKKKEISDPDTTVMI